MWRKTKEEKRLNWGRNSTRDWLTPFLIKMYNSVILIFPPPRGWRNVYSRHRQECQMVYFQTNKSQFGEKFWKDLEWKKFVYYMAVWNMLRPIWYSLQPFGNLIGIWLYFLPFWYNVSRKVWQPWSPFQSERVRFNDVELCCALLQVYHDHPHLHPIRAAVCQIRLPILRLLNLQLQRQRCSRLDRLYKVESRRNNLCFFKLTRVLVAL
jgi:hypothetical protein